jgi:hypothetical protein
MSILDDAIREHLELKRAHGADESELKKLEDEAFGPPGRPDDPDPFAEAPTEFLTAPATGADEAAADALAEPGGRRAPNIADLQEAPPPKTEEPAAAPEAEAEAATGEPADEEAPAVEQAIPKPEDETTPEPAAAEPEPEIDAGHSTEERHAIAEQPTEFFDVEAEMDAGADPRSPSDEQLVEAELTEPRLAPVDPLGPLVDTGPDAEVARAPEDDEPYEEDDFFSEQRLSEELNQALEAPVTDEHEVFSPEPESEEHTPLPPVEEHTAIYDVEHHAVAEEELELEEEEEEHHAEPEHSPFVDPDLEDDEDEDDEEDAAPPAAKQEDVLEETPDFLEDAPEDDDLWFEQKPPKDFDFDD